MTERPLDRIDEVASPKAKRMQESLASYMPVVPTVARRGLANTTRG